MRAVATGLTSDEPATKQLVKWCRKEIKKIKYATVIYLLASMFMDVCFRPDFH